MKIVLGSRKLWWLEVRIGNDKYTITAGLHLGGGGGGARRGISPLDELSPPIDFLEDTLP